MNETPTELDDITEATVAFGVGLRDVTTMVDNLEKEISSLAPAECPLDHVFTPGLYSRTVLMKAGTLLTSKIHKTEHPFVILRGDVSVWTREAGVIRYRAPFLGVTKPGTRRVLYIHADTIWATFHPTELTDIAQIEEAIIQPHVNPLLQRPPEPCLTT